MSMDPDECIHPYVCIDVVCMYMHAYVCMCVCMYMHAYVCMYACMYVSVCVCAPWIYTISRGPRHKALILMASLSLLESCSIL